MQLAGDVVTLPLAHEHAGEGMRRLALPRPPAGRKAGHPFPPLASVSDLAAGASTSAASEALRALPAVVVTTSLDTPRTSCTTRGDDLDPAAGIYVDGKWCHAFREKVADCLRGVWHERARALESCGKVAVEVACGGCAGGQLLPFRCGARTCPTCARAGSAKLAERILARIVLHDALMLARPWQGPAEGSRRRTWRLITLTTPASASVADRWSADYLHARVKHARRAFNPFWRSTSWGRQVRDVGDARKRARRDTSYVLSEEISPRGMVHLHVLVFGEYIAQRALQALWSKALGEPLAIVDVRRVRGDDAASLRGALKEVLKYATKGEKNNPRSNARARFEIVRAEHAAAVELAFRAVRRVEVGGALRAVKVTEDDGDADDVRPEDLHDRSTLACTNGCDVGAKPSNEYQWRWIGLVSHSLVRILGGFGAVPDAVTYYPGDDGGSANARAEKRAHPIRAQIAAERAERRSVALARRLAPALPF